MDKCAYCNIKIETPYTLEVGKSKQRLSCCSAECAQKTSSFLDYFDKTKKFFYISIFLSIGLIFSGVIAGSVINSLRLLAIFIAGGLVLFGFSIMILPFASPESYYIWGIRKTTRIVKLLGCICILLGPIIAIYILL